MRSPFEGSGHLGSQQEFNKAAREQRFMRRLHGKLMTSSRSRGVLLVCVLFYFFFIYDCFFFLRGREGVRGIMGGGIY